MDSIENTEAARAKYYEIIEAGAEGDALVRAVVGVSRTLVYQGEGLTGTESDEDIDTRRALFKECWDSAVEAINPEAIGYAAPEYYYFKSVCMAYYGQVSGTIENLGLIRGLNNAITTGLEIPGGDLYEAAGIKRVKAAVSSNAKTKPLPGGIYNPELALQLIDEAIESEAYPGSYAGNLSCENYRRKVNVLVELERPADALETALFAIDEFEFLLEFEEIPAVIIAETHHCLKVVKGLAEELTPVEEAPVPAE